MTDTEIKLTQQQARDAVNASVQRQQLAAVNLRAAKENQTVARGHLASTIRDWQAGAEPWTDADERRHMRDQYLQHKLDVQAGRVPPDPFSRGTASDFVRRNMRNGGQHRGAFSSGQQHRNVKDAGMFQGQPTKR